ncbi:MAG: alpha/beta hydrolase [Marinagarivorans sp.]|nr:alpha/beta hydrolase [Marinagarivorans sp.]
MKNPVTLLLRGKDTVAPLRAGQMLSQLILPSRFKIIIDAGHNPMLSHSQTIADCFLQKYECQSGYGNNINQ